MEGLPVRREHLETFLGRHAPPEDGLHLPQGPPGEADSNISTLRLRSAHGQANDPAPRKAKARTIDRTRYKAHQNAVRRQGRSDKEKATRRNPISVVLEPEAGE